MMNTANIRPAYEIEKIPDTREFKRTVFSKDKSGKLVRKEVTEKGGFMCYFPQGHSIRIRNEAELKAQALHGEPHAIDMEHGIAYPAHMASRQASLKNLVDRNTRSARGDAVITTEDLTKGEA